MAKITDPMDDVPNGLPEKKDPAVNKAPLLKTIPPGSAAVRRWAVVAVDENFILPLIFPVAVVARTSEMTLTALKFNAQPAGISRSVLAEPVRVNVAAAAL